MDSFEWNKIIGAVLGTLLFVFIVKEVASIVFHAAEEPEGLAYKIEIPEDSTQAQAEQKPEVVDFGALLREASAERGETVAKRCLQCHTFEKGGANKTGPNLWGILGSDIAAHDGFNYSNALRNMDGQWTYERIYEFVGAPSRYIPGTNMNFAGLRRQSARIDLLAYLRQMDDDPPPIPDPLPEETEEPAEGTAEEGAGEEAGEDAAQDEEAPAADDEATENGDAATKDAPEAEETGSGAKAAGEEDAEGPNGAGAEEDAGEENTAEDAAEDAPSADDGDGGL